MSLYFAQHCPACTIYNLIIYTKEASGKHKPAHHALHLLPVPLLQPCLRVHIIIFIISQVRMSKLFNTKSNDDIIYAFLGFDLCRKQIEQYENSKRTGTPGWRNPTYSYAQAKKLQECYEQRSTKLDPISIPIFNDVRECLFQNDSHIFNCKEELNELVESHLNPDNYKEMLKWSTPKQRQPKRYNSAFIIAEDDFV